MTPQQFMANFGAIAEAPEGINKLRELVLKLASSGGLSSGHSNDESVEILIAMMGEKRAELVAQRALKKKELPVEPRGPEDGPRSLPSHWRWVPLTQAFQAISVGRNKIKSSEVEETGESPVVDQGQSFVAGYTNKAERLIKIPGPVVVFGDHTRALKFVDFDFVAGADGVKILRPLAGDERYFFRVLQGFDLKGRGYGRHYKILCGEEFPLPPLAEQKRIVAKVDQLMAMLDDLEQRQEKKRTVAIHVSKASLDSLVNAEDPDQLARAWERVSKNFGVVAGAQNDASMLRSAVISLAVTGRMVAAGAGSGHETYEHASAHLRHLMATGGARRRKLVPLAVEDGPVPLPSHWTWARLDHLAGVVEYGTSQKAHTEKEGYPVLRMGDIQDGELDFSNLKYVPKTTDGIEGLLLEPLDLLFNRTNSYERVGKMGIYRGEPDTFTFASYLIRVRVLLDFCDPEFVNAYFRSSLCRTSQIEPEITQQTNQANFNGTKLKNVLVPLPPRAEQALVVRRLNSLLSLVDELARLQSALSKQANTLAGQATA